MIYFTNVCCCIITDQCRFKGTSDILRGIIPLYLVIALGTFVGPMLFVIVEEKEKKIKESMKMVGLRGSVFW